MLTGFSDTRRLRYGGGVAVLRYQVRWFAPVALDATEKGAKNFGPTLLRSTR